MQKPDVSYRAIKSVGADKGILERKVRMTQCCVTKERIG